MYTGVRRAGRGVQDARGLRHWVRAGGSVFGVIWRRSICGVVRRWLFCGVRRWLVVSSGCSLGSSWENGGLQTLDGHDVSFSSWQFHAEPFWVALDDSHRAGVRCGERSFDAVHAYPDMSTGVEFWWQVRRSLSVVMTMRECGEIDLGHMTGELADIVMGGDSGFCRSMAIFGKRSWVPVTAVNGDTSFSLGMVRRLSGMTGRAGIQASFRATMAVFSVRWRRSTIPLACGW